MKVKAVPFSEVKSKLFSDPEFVKAYHEELRQEAIRDLLQSMKEKSGLTSTEIAKRMEISQPAISKLERNAVGVRVDTLQRLK